MKKLCICIVFGLIQQLGAQENTIYYELAGISGWMSLNYERRIIKNSNLLFRAGIGISPFEVEEEILTTGPGYIDLNFPSAYLSIPLSTHYLLDLEKGNYLDFGLGYTWQEPSEFLVNTTIKKEALHHLFGSIGYRKHFGKNRSWMWRLSFSPRIASNHKLNVPHLWGGLSLGKRF